MSRVMATVVAVAVELQWKHLIVIQSKRFKNGVDELAACQQVSKWSDDDDRSIESIEKEIGVDIQNQFSANKENVDKIVTERKAKLEDKKKQEEAEQRKREYRHYLKLKQQFEKE